MYNVIFTNFDISRNINFYLLELFVFVCREREHKPGPVNDICDDEPHIPQMSNDKSQTIIPGDILYPCSSNQQALQQQMTKDNRILWATLTPRGTRHFVSATETFSNYDDHYEVIDYHGNRMMRSREGATLRINPIKSFENTGFTDFDYEDDHDSGYQEPHEVISTLNRNSPRPTVSSPTRIEHPNIPPLNMHPHRGHSSGATLTLQKKSTLGRRPSDTINMYGTANI